MPGFWKSAGNILFGTPGRRENVSNLREEQEPLYQQAVNAGLQRGAGGAFGEAADYYRNNLSDNPQDFDKFAAPQLRQFNEDIIPGLSEQFAGMGAGGLSSSGFRNAAVNAGADLSERLGSLRAQLRQNSAQGLANIGQQGLNSYSTNMQTEAPTEGLAAPLLGAVGAAVGGPALGALGAQAGNGLTNAFGGQKVAKNSSPYGMGQSPMQQPNQSNFQLPNRAF